MVEGLGLTGAFAGSAYQIVLIRHGDKSPEHLSTSVSLHSLTVTDITRKTKMADVTQFRPEKRRNNFVFVVIQ